MLSTDSVFSGVFSYFLACLRIYLPVIMFDIRLGRCLFIVLLLNEFSYECSVMVSSVLRVAMVNL